MTKKDRLTISSDEILKKAALEAEKEVRRQMDNYCSRARELPDDCEAIDEEFLEFARAYDAKHKKPPSAFFTVCAEGGGFIPEMYRIYRPPAAFFNSSYLLKNISFHSGASAKKSPVISFI